MLRKVVAVIIQYTELRSIELWFLFKFRVKFEYKKKEDERIDDMNFAEFVNQNYLLYKFSFRVANQLCYPKVEV